VQGVISSTVEAEKQRCCALINNDAHWIRFSKTRVFEKVAHHKASQGLRARQLIRKGSVDRATRLKGPSRASTKAA
jgi:hypothetical protein